MPAACFTPRPTRSATTSSSTTSPTSASACAPSRPVHRRFHFGFKYHLIALPGYGRILVGMARKTMSKAKEELTKLIEEQPEDSSREEIIRELAFHVMVERGLADSDAGRVISNDEIARRIRSWQR